MSCEIYIITQRFNSNEIEVAFTSKDEMINYVKEKSQDFDSYLYSRDLTIINDGKPELDDLSVTAILYSYDFIQEQE